MAKIFKKHSKKVNNNRPKKKNKAPEDIMDPILYNGGLDKEKYPQLPLENDNKPEEDVENPLNQRRGLD